jgi:outer membrane receptor protein involved in Fe transport
LLYGQAINRPSFQQNTDKFLGIQDYLKPEKIHTYEINYIGSFFKGFTTSISVFKNELNDLLLRKHGLNPDGSYYSYFSNIGEMITYGSEITLKAELISKLLIELSGTYQKTEDQKNKNVDVAFSPNWLAYGQISYRHKNMTSSITGRYVDKMKAYWDPTIKNVDGSFGNRIGRDVPGYVSIGANLRIENFLLKGLYLNIKGANLLDTDIFFPTYTNNPWANQGTMDLGRSFLFTMGMKI